MGLTWAIAWGIVGGIPRWVFGFNTDAPLGLIFGVLGFVGGLTCAAVIVLAERRSRFEQMTIPRVASWGGAAGLLLSAVFVKAASLGTRDALVIVPTFAVACAVCASGTLALARRAYSRVLPEVHG